MRTWRIRFREKPIFDLVKSGIKTVETRALNPDEPERYFGEIAPGDILECEFVDTGEVLPKTIKDARLYKNFSEYLEKEDLTQVFGRNIDSSEARNIHLSFPGYAKRLKEFGIVAIEICDNPSVNTGKVENIKDYLYTDFFDSLREDYGDFDDWFSKKCLKENRDCFYFESEKNLGGVAILKIEDAKDHRLADVDTDVLKICTLKVGKSYRKNSLGHEFINNSSQYARANGVDTIYLTVKNTAKEKHRELIDFLMSQGFYKAKFVDSRMNEMDTPYIKEID